MFKELRAPIYVQWEVTPYCNYHCIHCYNGWRNYDDIKYNIPSFAQIVDEIIKNEIFSVTITGGEPAIVLDIIEPYLLQLKKAGIAMSLNTNASLITFDMAKKLNSIGINSVLVSVPSGNSLIYEQVTGKKEGLKHAVKGIGNLIDNNIKVAVNMVITSKNIHTIYETAMLFKNIPISCFAATRAATPCEYETFSEYRIDDKQLVYMFDELLRIKEELKIKVSSLEFYPFCVFREEKHFDFFGNRMCSAGKTEASISYNGTIKPCPHTAFSYGNIQDGLSKAWKRMNGDWRERPLIPEQCVGCVYRVVCAGGCKQEAYNYSHSLEGIDPLAKPVCKYKRKKKEIVLKEEYIINPVLRRRKECDEEVALFVQDGGFKLVRKELADILSAKKIVNKKWLCESLGICENEGEKILTDLARCSILI